MQHNANHRNMLLYVAVCCSVLQCVAVFVNKLSRVNESYHMWMSHAPCEWVMSHMLEARHLWMSHVTHLWDMSHIHHVTCEWVMSYMSRVMSHMNESCHIWMRSCHMWKNYVKYERVPSPEWVMSRINASCHIWRCHIKYERVTPDMNGSCHTRMSHVT